MLIPPRARVIGFAAALAVAGCATSVLRAPELQVVLAGSAEAPPNRSTASGKASFWVRADRTLSGIVETSGMSASAAHLHLGAAGATGPVVVDLVRMASDAPFAMEQAPVSGAGWSVPRSARLSEEQYRAFVAGEIHVHVHSALYPDGEIRGQLKP